MPYPSQVTPERIIEHARRVIETEGAAALSLGHLATGLGIKAPSLYRYYASKETLIRAINEETYQRLFAALDVIDDEAESPTERILKVARAYRTFASENAPTYMLAYSDVPDEARVDEQEQEARALPFQAVFATWIGEKNSLPALRGLLALMHGYVALEINGQFRRGGDLAGTYEQVIRAYLAGWT